MNPNFGVAPVSTPAPLDHDVLAVLEASDRWAVFPYRAILISFSDGSTFELATSQLVRHAAKRISLPGVSAAAHLEQQVLPLITEHPEQLLEIAKGLKWAELAGMAHQKHWAGPAFALEATYPKGVTIALHH